MRRLIPLALALACWTALPTAAGAEVRPDPAFGGGNGFVKTKLAGGNSLAYAATVLGNKVVVAGQQNTKKGTGQILVARYRQNGRLDRSFASRGIFRTALPKKKGPFIATAIARQRSTGKLLIAGGYGLGSMLALRLTANGRLDRSFGGRGNGLAIVRAGGTAQSIAVQPNGRILLGGSNANSNGRPMVIARLMGNGKLDRSFGSGGLANAMFWDPTLAASAGATGLAVLSGGVIAAAGHLDYIGGDGHGSAGIFELAANGSPVGSFGTSGHVEVAFDNPSGGFAQWFPCAMAVDSTGRITVTGDGSAGSGSGVLTTRLTAAGAPDPSFGQAVDGRSVVPGAKNFSDTTCGAALGSQGNLTVGVGSSLAQLGPGGEPNLSFAPGGITQISKPKGVEINAAAQSGSNRVVVAGSAGPAIYVARYRL